MEFRETLFDDQTLGSRSVSETTLKRTTIKKEDLPVDRLRNLEDKINAAVERVKALKEEKVQLEHKISDLQNLLNEKNIEIEALKSEKTSIGSQIQELLDELDTIEA